MSEIKGLVTGRSQPYFRCLPLPEGLAHVYKRTLATCPPRLSIINTTTYGGERGSGLVGRGIAVSTIFPTKPTDVRIQRLKSALWFSIGKIVDEETLRLGVNATPQFIGALTELVWAQIGRPHLHLTAKIHAHADMICH